MAPGEHDVAGGLGAGRRSAPPRRSPSDPAAQLAHVHPAQPLAEDLDGAPGRPQPRTRPLGGGWSCPSRSAEQRPPFPREPPVQDTSSSRAVPSRTTETPSSAPPGPGGGRRRRHPTDVSGAARQLVRVNRRMAPACPSGRPGRAFRGRDVTVPDPGHGRYRFPGPDLLRIGARPCPAPGIGTARRPGQPCEHSQLEDQDEPVHPPGLHRYVQPPVHPHGEGRSAGQAPPGPP